MGFNLFGDQRDQQLDVAAFDFSAAQRAGPVVQTSLQRQEKLFSEGYRFEAALARAALVETLTSFYLRTRQAMDGMTFDAVTTNALGKNKLTFLMAVKALEKANAVADPQVIQELLDYADERNDIAHSLLGSFGQDFEGHFRAGYRLARWLWTDLSRVAARLHARRAISNE